MKFENIRSDSMSKEYKVTIGADEIEQRIVHMVERRAKTFKLHGFRVGSVPLDIVRKHVEHSVLDDVLNAIARDAYRQLLAQEENKSLAVKPVYKYINTYEPGKDMELEFYLDFAPVFDLQDLDIKLEKIIPNVREEDIDGRINIIKQSNPKREKSNGPVSNNDIVEYKASCFKDGVKLEKRSFKDQLIVPIDIADDAEFLKNFIGKNVKDTFEFIPATEKDLKYIIVIKSIEKAIDLDDTAYAKFMKFNDLQEFRDFVKRGLENEINNRAMLYHKNQILEILIKNYSFDLPEKIVEIEFKNVIASVRQDLQRDKELGEATDADLAKTDEELREEYKDIVNKRVLLGYVLSKVAQKNNIIVSDAELQQEILFEIESAHPSLRNRIYNYYANNESAVAYRRATIMEEKVIRFLMSKADCTEVSKTREEVEAIVEKILED